MDVYEIRQASNGGTLEASTQPAMSVKHNSSGPPPVRKPRYRTTLVPEASVPEPVNTLPEASDDLPPLSCPRSQRGLGIEAWPSESTVPMEARHEDTLPASSGWSLEAPVEEDESSDLLSLVAYSLLDGPSVADSEPAPSNAPAAKNAFGSEAPTAVSPSFYDSETKPSKTRAAVWDEPLADGSASVRVCEVEAERGNPRTAMADAKPKPVSEERERSPASKRRGLARGAWDAIVARAKAKRAEIAEEGSNAENESDDERAQRLSDEGFALLRESNLEGAWEAWSEAPASGAQQPSLSSKCQSPVQEAGQEGSTRSSTRKPIEIRPLNPPSELPHRNRASHRLRTVKFSLLSAGL